MRRNVKANSLHQQNKTKVLRKQFYDKKIKRKGVFIIVIILTIKYVWLLHSFLCDF